MHLRLPVLLLCAVLGATAAHAAPYDEAADARAAVDQALVAAKRAHQRVLLIFGANWCEDCRALDASLATPRNAQLMAREFRIVKIDVGRFDHNLDIDAAYGHPIKGGIPAAVLVDADRTVLYSTRAGELANARRMDTEGVYHFFEQVLAQLPTGR